MKMWYEVKTPSGGITTSIWTDWLLTKKVTSLMKGRKLAAWRSVVDRVSVDVRIENGVASLRGESARDSSAI